ncbi:primosomal protein N' family DNA-binding protein [Nocardia sp. NPDC003693]
MTDTGPAAGRPIARVLPLLEPAHLDRDFDYLVPPEMDEIAQPGVRVRVRFSGRVVDGYILERLEKTDHTGRLVRLDRVVSSERVLTPEILRLVTAVAARYAGTRADVLRLAIPPRHAKVETEGPDGSTKVTKARKAAAKKPKPARASFDDEPVLLDELDDDSFPAAAKSSGGTEDSSSPHLPDTAPGAEESVAQSIRPVDSSRPSATLAPTCDDDSGDGSPSVAVSSSHPAGSITEQVDMPVAEQHSRAAAPAQTEQAPETPDPGASIHPDDSVNSSTERFETDSRETAAHPAASSARQAEADASTEVGASTAAQGVPDATRNSASSPRLESVAVEPVSIRGDRGVATGSAAGRVLEGAASSGGAAAGGGGAAEAVETSGNGSPVPGSAGEGGAVADAGDRGGEEAGAVEVSGVDVAGLYPGWGRYVHGHSFVGALAAGRGPRAGWQALPGEEWAGRLAELAAVTVGSGRSAILMVPDQRDLERVLAECVALVGESAVGLAAGLGPSARYRRWLAALRGTARVVVGTRSAVFAPVKDLGLIALWDDGDDTYAEPRSPYPHAREVAMLRAHETGAAFVAGGFARTAEVQAIVESGWAHDLLAERALLRQVMPRIIAPGDSDAALERDPMAKAIRIPGAAFLAARKALAAGEPVLVQVPRRGYIPALSCSKCRTPARCRHCNGPLALPDDSPVPQSNRAGRRAAAQPDGRPSARSGTPGRDRPGATAGDQLGMPGMHPSDDSAGHRRGTYGGDPAHGGDGTGRDGMYGDSAPGPNPGRERGRAGLTSARDGVAGAHSPACRWCGITEAAFRCGACGSRALRAVVIGAARTAEELGRAFPGVPVRGSGGASVLNTVPEGPQVVVSTIGAEPTVAGGYGVAMLLDGWALLGRADLRAAEDTLRRWMSAAALVRAGGQAFVMADSGLPTVSALVRWDPVGHAHFELEERTEVRFPPAVRLAAIDGTADSIAELLTQAQLPDQVEVLGPVPLPPGARKPFSSGDSPAEVERMILRVDRAGGTALSRALVAAQAVRSTHKSDDPLRVQIDPIDIG